MYLMCFIFARWYTLLDRRSARMFSPYLDASVSLHENNAPSRQSLGQLLRSRSSWTFSLGVFVSSTVFVYAKLMMMEDSNQLIT